MKEQFEGEEGKKKKFRVINDNELIEHSDELAKRFTKVVKLKEYEKEDYIYKQGDTSNHCIYLTMMGQVNLFINGVLKDYWDPGQIFGEFPFLQPSLSYTVAARPKEKAVIGVVSENDFEEIAKDYPVLWKNLAKILVDRFNKASLRENPVREPRVFIGHGRSELWRAVKDHIQALNLNYDEFNRQPVAGLSITDRLSDMIKTTSLAIIIFTAEDERADGDLQPRMNVIHEAGLFQGNLGFNKVIILLEEGCKKFSNIHGLNYISFPKGNIEASFHEVDRVLTREGLKN